MAAFAVASVASAFAGSVGALWAAAATPAGRAVLLVVLFGGAGRRERPRRQAGARLVEAATVAKLLPLVVLVGVGIWSVQPGVPELSGPSCARRARPDRHRADLRLSRRRDRAGAERRSARSGAHGAARAVPRARDHDDAVSADPEGGAGTARAGDRRLRRRAAGRGGGARSRVRRPAAGPGRRHRLDVRLRRRRHAWQPAHAVRVRARRRPAGGGRARPSALPHAVRGDRASTPC